MTYKKCCISVLPAQWERIESWCEKLGIAYAGQGLPAISFQALQHLMKELNVREQLTGPEKCAILERFDHRCAFCGSRAKRMEFDHIVRHADSFGAPDAEEDNAVEGKENKQQEGEEERWVKTQLSAHEAVDE